MSRGRRGGIGRLEKGRCVDRCEEKENRSRDGKVLLGGYWGPTVDGETSG